MSFGDAVKWVVDIDVRKVATFGSGIIVPIAGLIALGKIDLHDMVPEVTIPFFVAWSKAIAIVGPVLMGAQGAAAWYSPRKDDPSK